MPYPFFTYSYRTSNITNQSDHFIVSYLAPQEPDNLSKTDVPCPVRTKRVHHLSLQCFSTDKRITKKTIYCQSTEHSTAIHTQRSLILGRLIQQNILSSS